MSAGVSKQPSATLRIVAPVVAIEAVNSTDYVRKVLATCAAGKVALIATEQARKQQYFGLQVAEHVTPEIAHGWLRMEFVPRDGDLPAQIVSTSGTEGVPKGIVLTSTNLADTVRRLNSIMEVDSSISEYVGVPVTHSFGLGRCRAVLAAGGSVYLPEKGFNLGEIQEMLLSDRINAISAVPTLWRLVLQNQQLFEGCAHKVKWIEIGSQYMSATEKTALRRLFPSATIVQHYGLTEASRSTFLKISEVREASLGSVGAPTGDVKVAIGANGRIRIRGSNVAAGRVADGNVHPIVDDEGWFETSDRGHFEDGQLCYDGRDDDVINCGGMKVSPEPLEAALRNSFGHLGEIAICGVPDPLRGEGFMIAVRGNSQDEDEALANALDKLLSGRNILARSSIHVRHVGRLPTTANGKVQRRKLAGMFTPPARRNAAASAHGDHTISDLFARQFGASRLAADASFADLGGDSLNYVQMGIDLEKRLGRLPENWDKLSIRALEDLARQASAKSRRLTEPLDTGTALRAFAITVVVAVHAGFSAMYGATIMLMLLIGFNFARFQSSALFRGEVWGTLWRYSKKILLPFYLMQVVYTLISGNFEAKSYLLISNFFYNTSQFLVPVWFVLNLMQLLVLVGLFFSCKPLRLWLRNDASGNSLTLLSVTIAFQALMYVFVQHMQYKLFYPHMYLPVFWLGWCTYHAGTRHQKWICTAMLLTLIPLNVNIGIQHLWLLFAGLVLIWIPKVHLPRAMNVIAVVVAAATFHIFIFNEFLLWQTHEAFDHLGLHSRLLAFSIAMGACMLLWWLMDRVLPPSLRRNTAPQGGPGGA